MPKAKYICIKESSIEYSQYFDKFSYWLLASTGLMAASLVKS